MSGLGTLFEALQAEADELELVRQCANGCGVTLPAGAAGTAYTMCDRCVLLTSGKLFDCPCGREWTAKREAHCAVCHRHFSSDSAFDAHISVDHGPCDEAHKVCIARSVHRDPPRLIQVEMPHGVTWTWPGTRPAEINRSTA